MIAVVPHERVDCLNSAEEGEIPCEETGLCKTTFDSLVTGLQRHCIKTNN